jgi:hypothetical protein
MFKSRPTYLMQIDAQLRIPPGIRDRIPELAHMPDNELVAVLIVSLEPQVMDAAAEELSRRGQRRKKRIVGNGHVQETGADYIIGNRLGEHHATFRVAFKGDHDRAVDAAWAWAGRLENFGGIESIGHLSLRGTDGTFLHWFDEETEEAVANMSPEMIAMIDEMMDSVASPT